MAPSGLYARLCHAFLVGYISPICPEAPHGRISTKFCPAVEVVDVITSDRLRDIDSVVGQQ